MSSARTPLPQAAARLRTAAHWYAGELGWPVFPLHTVSDGRCSCGKTHCSSPGKHPRTEHGFKDASTDPDTIDEWWEKWANANIGIRTGEVSGFFVLDIDPRNGGDVEVSIASLPETVRAKTGGGGAHLLFQYPGFDGLKSIGNGCDIKSNNGYIVVSPSVHECGETYEWINEPSIVSIAKAPDSLLDKIRRSTPSHAPVKSALRSNGQPATPATIAKAVAYIHKIPGAVEGQNGDDQTFGVACTLVRDFALTKDQAMPLMVEYNRKCVPPWPEPQLAKKLENAIAYGGGNGEQYPLGRKVPQVARCVTRLLSEIEPREVRWLWPGYVPSGKLTIIAGDPGLGKSYASMDIAARTSNGRGWPTVPNQEATPRHVVILNAEDDPHDTIRPRLDALDANVHNISIVDGVVRTAESDTPAHLSLATDLPLLEETIADKSARLVIIDPLSAYLGQIDSHRDSEVRGILSPLRDLAERQDVAVVAIMHLNKTKGTNALHRAIGSVAFTAACRMMWLVTKDPDNDLRRLLLPAKSNLKSQGEGLAFNIMENGMVAWHATPVIKTANQVLEELQTTNSQARDEAESFLRDVLAGGPVAADEIKRLTKGAGIAERTLWRAKAKIGVNSSKEGMSDTWKWRLGDEGCQEECQVNNVAPFG